MTTETTADAGTVRFGLRPQRGLILGLSAPRVACLLLAAAVMTPSLLLAGVAGFVVSGVLWGPLIGLCFVRWNDRPAVETLPTAAHYAARRALGQLDFRARPEVLRPVGTLALPGDAAALRVRVDDAGTAFVHDPHARTLTVVAAVRHPAYVLLSPEDQARRVATWGRVLAGVAAQGTCARLQVLETAMPDHGNGIEGWFAGHRAQHAPPWAAGEYADLLAVWAPAASTHRTLIAVSLDVAKAARSIRAAGGGLRGGTLILRQDMATFEASLREADLDVSSWLGPDGLGTVLRHAYDPAGAAAVSIGSVRPGLATAGPVAVQEHWDHLRHDRAYSAVLWISQWPRIEVTPSFLHGLVFQPGVRRTLSITLTPLSTVEAMRDIRKAKVEYVTDAAQKARIGSIADLADARELEDVLDRERSLVAGHADLRFTGLITLTAGTRDGLDEALALIQRAATQCACETRLLCGQQARAFASAALPLARRVH